MSEVQPEPIPGLPELLPEGERILWQGRPKARALARRALHLPWVALYFAFWILARVAVGLADGRAVLDAVGHGLVVLPLALAGLGILYLVAWMEARSTLYTITDRRVVLRFGVALTLNVNLPFREVRAAALRVGPAGTGDLVLTLAGPVRLGYLYLWPHVRPLRLRTPEPMLTAIPGVEAVAALLADALSAAGRRSPVAPANTAEADWSFSKAVGA